jgi:protocatechuate 3,4-dioxygenase alpha subunit
MIEILQTDAEGRYPDPQSSGKTNSYFSGFGRCDTGVDSQNKYIFETIKPGKIDTETAPHINVTIFMRGLLLHVFTRIYFSDEGRSNSADAVLSTVPVDRQKTLIAKKVAGVTPVTYVFDVFLQGENETVFFDI